MTGSHDAMPAATAPPAEAVAGEPPLQDKRSCLLSNGRYTVMLRGDGAGYSRWQGLGLTRWRESGSGASGGLHLWLRNEEGDGRAWSATHRADDDEPAAIAADFSVGRARFTRRVSDIESRVDVAVAPDADVELRCVALHNHGAQPRKLVLTAFAEAVIGPVAADDTHPAFSKMFVQTEWDASHGLLLATRRRRTVAEPSIWVACALQIEGQPTTADQAHETDRLRFIGRGRSLRDAQAMAPGGPLSSTTGCVLDPVLALRETVAVPAGGSIRFFWWMTAATSRADAMALHDRLADPDAAARLFEDAVRHAVAEHARLAIAPAQATRYDDWLAPLLVPDSSARPDAAVLVRGRGGPPTLWAAGISGDRPIVLMPVRLPTEFDRVRELLRAQDDWRSKRFGVDVVLLIAAVGASADVLQSALEPLTRAQRERIEADAALGPAAVFLLREDSIGELLRDALFTAARLVLGPPRTPASAPETLSPVPGAAERATQAAPPARKDFLATGEQRVEFPNGIGAFTEGGRAYRIDLGEGRTTPAPWINVIANPLFGTMLSARGGGHTWSINSQQNPLTPWPNDPVSDPPQETIYLRDDDSGAVWSATVAPIRVEGARYVTIHGKGWTRFESDAQGLDSELTVCVPVADPVKVSRLRLVNRSAGLRRLTLTAFLNWALGPNGTAPAPFVVTSRDPASGALFARNAWRPDFADRVAFADFGDPAQSVSGDRAAFIGAPTGHASRPKALHGSEPLVGQVGAGLEPCAALQRRVELPPGTEIELVFLLGDAASEDEARALVGRHRQSKVDELLREVRAHWDEILDTVRVTTPDRAMDLMLNDWLLYQVLGCRVWARTGYYQSSGAYGFRDQLQDVMALCISRPDLAREQVLRAAGRQFAEGDVQHWWLPPAGRGVRTRISDDRVWLVCLAMRYVEVTGDAAVLDVELPFLTGPLVGSSEADAFFQPGESADTATLYRHCLLALDASLGLGAHGLPLMQTGDWNDGMNRVGELGRGESCWLGWLLLTAIAAFAPVADKRGDAGHAARWRNLALALRESLEAAWDGAWYRRGYYDDGTPLGSSASGECRIDTIAQSWSVIAAADPGLPTSRSAEAMASVDALLVDRDNRIARLFTPPFDSHSEKDPGYIKGYPPGVRENGGQYTHGATWSVFAWAGLGDGDRAFETFDLLNPIRHADSPEAVARYRVEPYVACADVYAEPPHVGRGGWTWYTGSAAWLYRAGLEAVLGFHLVGDTLRLVPCIPRRWPGYRVVYQRRGPTGRVTVYDITVDNAHGAGRRIARLEVDGQVLAADGSIALADDGATHAVRAMLGAPG